MGFPQKTLIPSQIEKSHLYTFNVEFLNAEPGNVEYLNLRHLIMRFFAFPAENSCTPRRPATKTLTSVREIENQVFAKSFSNVRKIIPNQFQFQIKINFSFHFLSKSDSNPF